MIRSFVQRCLLPVFAALAFLSPIPSQAFIQGRYTSAPSDFSFPILPAVAKGPDLPTFGAVSEGEFPCWKSCRNDPVSFNDPLGLKTATYVPNGFLPDRLVWDLDDAEKAKIHALQEMQDEISSRVAYARSAPDPELMSQALAARYAIQDYIIAIQTWTPHFGGRPVPDTKVTFDFRAYEGTDPAWLQYLKIAGAGAWQGFQAGSCAAVMLPGKLTTPTSANTVAAKSTTWNPLNGPGPLGEKVAGTFRSATYTETVTSDATTLYRVYGGNSPQIGPYWTRTPPAGPLQSTIDSALNPAWGNAANKVVKIQVPAGTRIFEGAAASQGELVGGGNQVFIQNVNPSWIVP